MKNKLQYKFSKYLKILQKKKKKKKICSLFSYKNKNTNEHCTFCFRSTEWKKVSSGQKKDIGLTVEDNGEFW